jgi:hypothetical protein
MSDKPIVGFQELTSTGTDKSAHEFLIEKVVNRIATTALVKVTAVTNAGTVAAVGFVDVIPMVHQVDGAGNPTPHGEIHHLPYFRVQGGADAVILDPKVGDIGVAVFCSRDISAVKRQKKEAAPGSRRRYDWADGIYVGGVLNGTPQQYVRFSTTGVDIVTPNNITINAANATLDSSGNLAVKGEVTAKVGASQVTLSGHHQSGVAAGVATSGAPVPGT